MPSAGPPLLRHARPLRAGTGPCSVSGWWTEDAPTPVPLPVSARQPAACLAVLSHWVLAVLLLPWEAPPGGTVWGWRPVEAQGKTGVGGSPEQPRWGWGTVVQRAVDTWAPAQARSRVAAGSKGSGHGGQGTAWASRGTLQVVKASPLPRACGRAPRQPRLEAGQGWSCSIINDIRTVPSAAAHVCELRGEAIGGGLRGLEGCWALHYGGRPREEPHRGACIAPGRGGSPRAVRPSSPVPLPVLSTLSWLSARGAGRVAGAAASPTSGPGARGTSLFCSTEEVALSRARACGCGGGGGCGPEGLGVRALGSILPVRSAAVRHTPGPAERGLLQPLGLGKERARQRVTGWGLPAFCEVSSSLVTAPIRPPLFYR